MKQETAVAVVSAEEQAEWDKLAGEGEAYINKPRAGMFIPTIKLNNSDKVKTKTGVPLGNFILQWKDNGVEKFEDLGELVDGIILKVSYSIKSIYDPNNLVNFFSREFDDFQKEEVVVFDGKKKIWRHIETGEEISEEAYLKLPKQDIPKYKSGGYAVMFCGGYTEWKANNQQISSRGKKNDFVLVVHLYTLLGGDFEKMKVVRVSISGKSMSNWFSYTNGDKEKGIDSIYSKGIQPHTHMHGMESLKETNPKGEVYYSVVFTPGSKLEIESLRKVVALQRELNDQLQAFRGGRKKEVVAELPEETGFEEQKAIAPVKDEDIPVVNTENDDDEIKIEDVPF